MQLKPTPSTPGSAAVRFSSARPGRPSRVKPSGPTAKEAIRKASGQCSSSQAASSGTPSSEDRVLHQKVGHPRLQKVLRLADVELSRVLLAVLGDGPQIGEYQGPIGSGGLQGQAAGGGDQLPGQGLIPLGQLRPQTEGVGLDGPGPPPPGRPGGWRRSPRGGVRLAPSQRSPARPGRAANRVPMAPSNSRGCSGVYAILLMRPAPPAQSPRSAARPWRSSPPPIRWAYSGVTTAPPTKTAGGLGQGLEHPDGLLHGGQGGGHQGGQAHQGDAPLRHRVADGPGRARPGPGR